MPFPLIAIPFLFLAGIGGGITTKGIYDMVDANDTITSAKSRNDRNVNNFECSLTSATDTMENLGRLELQIAEDFERFIGAFEKIHLRPEFSTLRSNAKIPQFNVDEIKTCSIASRALAGAATGVALGTIAGLGVNAAVTATGAAITGKVFVLASGAAFTKASLAIAGGSAIGASGGAAVGTIVIGTATLGVGLLAGGAVFAFIGTSLSSKADEAYSAMLRNEITIQTCVKSLREIQNTGEYFHSVINRIFDIYNVYVGKLLALVERETNWNAYNTEECLLVENTIRIVSVLHKLINTQLLVLKKADANHNGIPAEVELNKDTVEHAIKAAVSDVEMLCS